MTEIRTTTTGENLTHKILFSVAKWQMTQSNAHENGFIYADISAMMFAFHALEAYLNFLLQHLAPEIYIQERKFFNTKSYKGFEGRVKKVFELCVLAPPNASTAPYKTIRELKILRDTIAHGRAEKTGKTILHNDDAEAPLLEAPFRRLVSPEKASTAIQSVYDFCKTLHEAARPKVKYVWFGDDPFKGVQGHSSGESRVA